LVKTAIDSINGDVETATPSSRRCGPCRSSARGPLKLDEYDNPIQNVYVAKVRKIKHPVLGDLLINKPIKTYPAVSQFWTGSRKSSCARGPYKR